MPPTRKPAKPSAAQLVAALYDDPEQCAKVAKLRYVSPDQPGLTRLRKGKGFTYRDEQGRTIVDVKVRDRIRELAIPPAWRNVWISTLADGHILAVGEDERDRRQYIYHERWRSLRDQLNFYRLIGFGDALPAIREDVADCVPDVIAVQVSVIPEAVGTVCVLTPFAFAVLVEGDFSDPFDDMRHVPERGELCN